MISYDHDAAERYAPLTNKKAKTKSTTNKATEKKATKKSKADDGECGAC